MINKKNVKAKIENKKFSTVEKLDTTQLINCEVFIPKSDSRCGPCHVFWKHLTTMTHGADKEKSTSSKYIPNKYMLRKDLEKKNSTTSKRCTILKSTEENNWGKNWKIVLEITNFHWMGILMKN